MVLGAALVAAQNHQVVYDPSLYQAANVNRQGAGTKMIQTQWIDFEYRVDVVSYHYFCLCRYSLRGVCVIIWRGSLMQNSSVHF